MFEKGGRGGGGRGEGGGREGGGRGEGGEGGGGGGREGEGGGRAGLDILLKGVINVVTHCDQRGGGSKNVC